MNKTNKILGVVLASLAFASCADLDTAPDNNIITDDQKHETVKNNPEMAAAGVNGIYATMKQFMPNATALGLERHNDIGYPTIMMATDHNGMDIVSDQNGYNWAGNDMDFYDRVYTSNECQMVWNDLYANIYNANSVIASNDADSDNPAIQFYLAQGLGNRAFNYFVLAQLYQFNYKGNENKPCVPIITDENSEDATVNGCARNTVQEVYNQILKDINLTIDLLAKAEGARFTRDDHRYISSAVAYGLRARINLTMQNWQAAADDAKMAIQLAESEDIVPLSRTKAAKPGFWDAKDWMWGIIVDETDRVVTSGIINWISHMGSLNYGYGSYAGGRQINKVLYSAIPSTDVRKGWWTNADGISANLNATQQAYMLDTYPPFTNVKFGPDNDVFQQRTNANDIILMRAEEMYLIYAEATAMAGDPLTGAAFLEQFVTTFRNPNYTCTATTAEEVQNEVWMQRRVEFWGEGMSWFDIMRLGKNVDRRGSGIADNLVYNIASTDATLLWRIPEAEIQANKLISEEDNNEFPGLPQPVAE